MAIQPIQQRGIYRKTNETPTNLQQFSVEFRRETLSVEAKAFAVQLDRQVSGSNYKYTHKKGMFIRAKAAEGIDGLGYLGDDFDLG